MAVAARRSVVRQLQPVGWTDEDDRVAASKVVFRIMDKTTGKPLNNYVTASEAECEKKRNWDSVTKSDGVCQPIQMR